MNTGEVKEINILEMMDGAIQERIDYELAKVMKNCKDLNTDHKKARILTIELSFTPTEARILTIELSFTPTEARDSLSVKISVKSKLVSVKALGSTLLLGGTEDEPIVMEYVPGVPGQCTFAGTEQEEPKIISLARA